MLVCELKGQIRAIPRDSKGLPQGKKHGKGGGVVGVSKTNVRQQPGSTRLFKGARQETGMETDGEGHEQKSTGVPGSGKNGNMKG